MRKTQKHRSAHRFPIAALAVALALGLAVTNASQASQEWASGDLRPTKEQAHVAKSIVRQLTRHHYAQLELNDEFSTELFDLYADMLDPYRQFLTASEIAGFQVYRESLDDMLKRGDLGPAFEIFNLVQKRRVEQAEYFVNALEESLETLRFDIPEFIELDREDAEWPADMAAMLDLWRKQFKNDVLALKLSSKKDAEPKSNEDIRSTLSRRYAALQTRLGRTDADDVFQIYMNVLSRSFDPHTSYMPPVDAETFNMTMSLSFEGIGAVLGSDGEYINIQRLIPGGPAKKSDKLRAMDRILAVGQEGDADMVDIVGWRTDEAAEKIRGPKGSVVRLSVLRADEPDESAAEVVTIVRDQVQLEEQRVKAEIVETERDGETERIGIIELPAFYLDFQGEREGEADYRSSAVDVAQALADFESKGVDGVILDLRLNGGGSLTEAQRISGLFLGDVPIVQVRNGANRREILRSGVEAHYTGPLVVMVNGGSASASEILAAAIQDYGRGIVVGSRTWGKGTVQTILPVPDEAGQLKLTHAMFYRVSGGSTQARGVTPDVEFLDLFDAAEFGEGSIEGALEWDSVDSVSTSRTSRLAEALEPLKSRHTSRTSVDSDWLYIAGQQSLSREQRDVSRLSLEEATRKAERVARERRLLELENARRKAKGLDPVASLDELSESDEDEPDDEDPYREEAINVMVDLIRR